MRKNIFYVGGIASFGLAGLVVFSGYEPDALVQVAAFLAAGVSLIQQGIES